MPKLLRNTKHARIENHLSNYDSVIFYHEGKYNLFTGMDFIPSNIMDLDAPELTYYIGNCSKTVTKMFCYIPGIGIGYFIYHADAANMYNILKKYEVENVYKNGKPMMRPPFD